MENKKLFLSDVNSGEEVVISLMVMKKMVRDPDKIIYILADKSGEIKANIPGKDDNIIEGRVLQIEGVKDVNLSVKKYEFVSEYHITDYLPTVKRPIEDIMKEIQYYTDKYVVSEEGKALDDYFFKNKEFVDRFKRGIGGISMHHNYIGGLAEHTLNVMYLTVMLCERYNARRPEIAVLSAKLHDIGKIYEMYYDGPFKYTTRGEMEGHIVIGTEMIDEAIRQKPDFYSEDFILRVKGCIVQHHGKLEFGSPRQANTEDAFIVNYADTIDAMMNKIDRLKDKTEPGNWSEFDRRVETKLFL
ncbi:3'-5' exoribonuclease YhaM family protein [Clostridium oryzae]|uniref:3'-5' exoribonuclease YhaM n=1 Tax=Clostridium oryzae TaxID=1450648 RepID=A0A1V4II65_9CLOT|nr:3'-5' exoribonuclease YhaM family protein [Clostridium oryzae]OPJ59702.1 3'-5' exoribonuclease YhaM [Clostridium oryzae]